MQLVDAETRRSASAHVIPLIPNYLICLMHGHGPDSNDIIEHDRLYHKILFNG